MKRKTNKNMIAREVHLKTSSAYEQYDTEENKINMHNA